MTDSELDQALSAMLAPPRRNGNRALVARVELLIDEHQRYLREQRRLREALAVDGSVVLALAGAVLLLGQGARFVERGDDALTGAGALLVVVLLLALGGRHWRLV